MTPYVLACVYIVCLLAAERKQARLRVAAVGLWGSSVAVATLVMYAAEWPGSSGTWLNVLWSGLIAASIVWAFAVLRVPAGAPPATATLPPPGTMGTFVAPFEPEEPEAPPARHWVKPPREPGPARKRYEARRRRIPIVARERRKLR